MYQITRNGMFFLIKKSQERYWKYFTVRDIKHILKETKKLRKLELHIKNFSRSNLGQLEYEFKKRDNNVKIKIYKIYNSKELYYKFVLFY